MHDTSSDILAIEPTMIEAVDGSWLAVAGPGAVVRVGVLEPTQDEARLRFDEALHRVADALDRNGDA